MINACVVYDFRYNAEGVTSDDIKKYLSGIAKKYCFQLEQGDSGYMHFQGRMSLIKKRRKFEALPLFSVPPLYFEPTSKPEFLTGDAFYQMKLDTRVDGPWKDTDLLLVMTKQLELFGSYTLFPYQLELKQKSQTFSMRSIDLIYDPMGNKGKSIFSEFMEYHQLAEEIPPYRLMDDIFAWVCSRPVKKCYIMDMPRGIKKDKLGDLYAGIEVIKNGVAYDKRYMAKKIRFDRPRIFVFTNRLPEFSLMSKDRWNVWTITEDMELIKFDHEYQEYVLEHS